MKQKELTVLMVEPGKHPKVTKLKDDLDSLQKAVSIGADYQGLFEFANFETKSRRPVVGGRGVGHPFNRRYGLYNRFYEKPSSPASRTKETVERLSLFFASPSSPKRLKPLCFQ